MTKDYAIAVLQALWRYNICGYPEDEIREALDMAVEALKQERRSTNELLEKETTHKNM